MQTKLNLVGQRFGSLVVIGKDERPSYWHCQCDCGKESTVLTSNLRRGLQVSCGCHRAAIAGNRTRTHGLSASPENATWRRMLMRCYNPNMHNFKHYGGRGITVCDHWRHDFAAFYAAVGPRPVGHSIDKDTPGGDGHYHCDACGGKVRWADKSTQMRNRRPRQ